MKKQKISGDHYCGEPDSGTEGTGHPFCNISSSDKEANIKTAMYMYKEMVTNRNEMSDDDPRNAETDGNTDTASEGQTKQEQEKEYPCEYCDGVFQTKQALHRHLESHSKRESSSSEFLCNYCAKIYHSKRGLTRHMRFHTKNMFTCSICGKEFYENVDLNSHVRSVHTGECPFMCSYCGKTFAGKKQYRVHLKIHDGTQLKYNCSYCDKVYSKKQHLEGHINTYHLKIRPFSCHYCLKTFADKSNLNKHLSHCSFEKNMKAFNDL